MLAPLILCEEDAVLLGVQRDGVVCRRVGESTDASAIYSRAEGTGAGDESGTLRTGFSHVQGVLSSRRRSALRAEIAGARALLHGAWPPAGAEEVGTELLYERLAEAGYDYGPGFQGLRRVWRAGDEVFAEVALAEEHAVGAAGFCVHPALSDAALHALVLVALDGESSGELSVPFSFSGVRLYAGGASALRVCFGLRYGEDGGSWAASVVAVDEGGAAVFSIDELKTRALDRGALMSRHGGRDDLYELEWVPVMSSSNGSRPRVVLLGGGPVGVPGELECYADLGALEDAIAGGVAPA